MGAIFIEEIGGADLVVGLGEALVADLDELAAALAEDVANATRVPQAVQRRSDLC